MTVVSERLKTVNDLMRPDRSHTDTSVPYSNNNLKQPSGVVVIYLGYSSKGLKHCTLLRCFS